MMTIVKTSHTIKNVYCNSTCGVLVLVFWLIFDIFIDIVYIIIILY